MPLNVLRAFSMRIGVLSTREVVQCSVVQRIGPCPVEVEFPMNCLGIKAEKALEAWRRTEEKQIFRTILRGKSEKRCTFGVYLIKGTVSNVEGADLEMGLSIFTTLIDEFSRL